MVARDWTRTAKVDWKNLKGLHIVRVPIAYLRVLLRDEHRMDGSTRARFRRWASGENRDIRFEIDTMIASEMSPSKFVEDYHNLDFSAPEREAAEAVEVDLPMVAVLLYRGMTESIGIHIDLIDDSGGYVWPFFGECMEKMGACLLSMDLSGETRRIHIRYLAVWSLRVFVDFMEYYNKVLVQLCKNRKDLEVWKDVLENETGRDFPDEWDEVRAINKQYRDKAYSLVLERMREIDSEQRPSGTAGKS